MTRRRRPTARQSRKDRLLRLAICAILLLLPESAALADELLHLSRNLTLRNRAPVYLGIITFDAASGVVLPRGTIELEQVVNVSSYYRRERSDEFTLQTWAELAASETWLRYGVLDWLTLDAQIPFYWRGKSFIRPHSFVHSDPDTFVFRLSRNGVTIFENEARALGLGDLTLGASYLLHDGKLRLIGRSTAQLPTGDQSHGFSNNGLDFGGSLIAQVMNTTSVLSIAIGYLFPDDLEPFGLDSHSMAIGQVSIGGRLSSRFSGRIQASWQERGSSETGLEKFDTDAFIISFGAELLLKPSMSLFLNFHEDFFVEQRGQPDFMIDIGFRRLFF